MNQSVPALLISLLLLIATGCRQSNPESKQNDDNAQSKKAVDTHDSLVESQIDCLEKLTSTIEKIKTAEDANENKDELKALMDKMNDIESRMVKLGEPSKEIAMGLANKYEEVLIKINPVMIDAMNEWPKDVNEILAPVLFDLQKFR